MQYACTKGKYLCAFRKKIICPTSGKKSNVDQFGLDDDLWQHEAEGRHEVDERARRATVMPGVTHEPARLSQDRGRVHRASGQVIAQLEAVVGQVSDLEHK